jgi:hypothetical protein
LIQGVIRKDRNNHLKSFESIEHVTPLDPLDVILRLDELAKLNDGWLDGKGRAAAKEQLTFLSRSFEAFFDADLALPYLYPTAEGGVQAEWSMNGWEVSLDIDLEKQQGEYQALNLQDNTSSDLTISLGDEEGWNQLNAALRRLKIRDVEEQPSGS